MRLLLRGRPRRTLEMARPANIGFESDQFHHHAEQPGPQAAPVDHGDEELTGFGSGPVENGLLELLLLVSLAMHFKPVSTFASKLGSVHLFILLSMKVFAAC